MLITAALTAAASALSVTVTKGGGEAAALAAYAIYKNCKDD